MRLLGQFQTSLFFLQKDFARTKTQIKPKPTNKRRLSKQKTTKTAIFRASKLLREKKLVGFGLICVFVCAKYFRKKNYLV